jgi:hypothetical protein
MERIGLPLFLANLSLGCIQLYVSCVYPLGLGAGESSASVGMGLRKK